MTGIVENNLADDDGRPAGRPYYLRKLIPPNCPAAADRHELIIAEVLQIHGRILAATDAVGADDAGLNIDLVVIDSAIDAAHRAGRRREPAAVGGHTGARPKQIRVVDCRPSRALVGRAIKQAAVDTRHHPQTIPRNRQAGDGSRRPGDGRPTGGGVGGNRNGAAD